MNTIKKAVASTKKSNQKTNPVLDKIVKAIKADNVAKTNESWHSKLWATWED